MLGKFSNMLDKIENMLDKFWFMLGKIRKVLDKSVIVPTKRSKRISLNKHTPRMNKSSF